MRVAVALAEAHGDAVGEGPTRRLADVQGDAERDARGLPLAEGVDVSPSLACAVREPLGEAVPLGLCARESVCDPDNFALALLSLLAEPRGVALSEPDSVAAALAVAHARA